MYVSDPYLSAVKRPYLNRLEKLFWKNYFGKIILEKLFTKHRCEASNNKSHLGSNITFWMACDMCFIKQVMGSMCVA